MFGKIKLRDFLARRLQSPRMDFALERLKRVGFDPGVVFDIGAYQGDFAQMAVEIWPQCRVACFEVQNAPLDRLRAALRGRVQVIECLIGAEVHASVPLNLCETASSILQE